MNMFNMTGPHFTAMTEANHFQKKLSDCSIYVKCVCFSVMCHPVLLGLMVS